MSKLPNLTDCVPHLKGEYLKDVLAEYDYVIRIDAQDMDLAALRLIEEWCNEHFGDLNEHSHASPWQVSFYEKWPLPAGSRRNCELCFHFHNERFAMAFKLRWI